MSNKSASACPVCGRPQVAENRPFCSTACRDRDLLQWLGEGYRVPGPPQEQAGENLDD
ncbi:MAG: DNA gyrase inhibitor YacG [Sphingobium sp.]|nr:MAG: DNA gyrase inhibitor YacG [Sphingobium sp.]